MLGDTKALIQVKPQPLYSGVGGTSYGLGLILIKGASGDRW
jgi:hypothetical protein